ncbi:MAG: NAD(P)H-dependent oxidoreductase [Ruminococcus sp.]|nr:NAD(P)H-dependent oxidoreductase [Ruminococcus sp.]MBQ1903486.1 NAD(P)H-dependent oxidoreductase [Ruminococcus sp.]
MNALVVFFSASGVTAKVAQKLADALGTQAYEIKPQKPYTSADLDWRDKLSRSSVEMNDESCRPAIEAMELPLADADTVFVGFPVWWYREPSVIDTFLDTFDLKGKTIVPFATSGSSSIGDSGKHMQSVVGKGATVLEGKRFAAGVSENELAKWAKTLDI